MATQPAKPKTKAKKAVADEPVIHSIKGFDANLQCRGYQFKEGETYEHTGSVKVCNSGFHACTIDAHPLEVFGYYPPAGSRFHLVEQRGETNSDDSIKIASAKITIGYELSIGGLTKRAIEWVFARSKPEGENATGNQGAASVTGEQGAASATGEQGAASATGWQGAASATGKQGAASATGWQGAASATGKQGAASATGEQGAASATGWQGAASATGKQGAASVTGEQGAASATGEQGAASATGWQGAAMSCGYKGTATGALGNALFAVERDDNYNIISVAAGIVGKDGIELGAIYRCSGGKLVLA
jgi:hypothetical protein